MAAVASIVAQLEPCMEGKSEHQDGASEEEKGKSSEGGGKDGRKGMRIREETTDGSE